MEANPEREARLRDVDDAIAKATSTLRSEVTKVMFQQALDRLARVERTVSALSFAIDRLNKGKGPLGV